MDPLFPVLWFSGPGLDLHPEDLIFALLLRSPHDLQQELVSSRDEGQLLYSLEVMLSVGKGAVVPLGTGSGSGLFQSYGGMEQEGSELNSEGLDLLHLSQLMDQRKIWDLLHGGQWLDEKKSWSSSPKCLLDVSNWTF